MRKDTRVQYTYGYIHHIAQPTPLLWSKTCLEKSKFFQKHDEHIDAGDPVNITDLYSPLSTKPPPEGS